MRGITYLSFLCFEGLKLSRNLMDITTLRRIREVSGFQEGQLAFRYLGIPIIARSLKNADYEILTEKSYVK